MAAPTLVGSVLVASSNATSNANYGSTLQNGDVLIVAASMGSDPTTTNVTLTDTSGPTTIVSGLAYTVSDYQAGPGVRIWVYQFTSALPSGTVNIAINNWPGSGNRRWCAFAFRPPSGQKLATLASRVGSGKSTTGDTNPAWHVDWTAGSGPTPNATDGQAAVSVYMASAPSTVATVDFNADGTTGDPAAASMDNNTHSNVAFYNTYSAGTLASTASIKYGTIRGNISAAAQVLVVCVPAQARGNAAAKADGKYLVTRPTAARANGAAKSTIAAGHIYSGVFAFAGRGNAAAKAGATPHPKTAGGRANAAAGGFTDAYGISHLSGARGNAAAKAGGVGRVVAYLKAARANAAAKASAMAHAFVPAIAAGRSNAASKATAGGSVSLLPWEHATFTDGVHASAFEDGDHSGTFTDGSHEATWSETE